jgi:4-deoxy-L-threo-5-hexosulose-uronate ketol-isomerase
MGTIEFCFAFVSRMFHMVKSRTLPGPRETSHLNTGDLREAFLIENLFVTGELRLAVTDMDRLAIGAAMPITALQLPRCRELGGAYFTERREMGIVNVGQPGHVVVSGRSYSLEQFDFLYIGAGNEEISFEACSDSKPAFYFLSCPGHAKLPVQRVGRDEVQAEAIGDSATASRRVLRKYIHPGGARSCQLVMGRTELEPGSVWNTMPPHTHARRSEVYLYFGLGEGVVIHLMGQPEQTRHVVVSDLQAVLSPSWSIHSGAGTKPYSFIWGMAGENQAFEDMDRVEPSQLR